MNKGLVSSIGVKLPSNDTKTENSMPAYKTTYNACVDLFFLGAAYRERTEKEITDLFRKAYQEDEQIALRTLAYFRDARQGTGERRFFTTCLKWLSGVQAKINLAYIPTLGRWDDLLAFVDTPYQTQALDLIQKELTSEKPDGLCAKWMPRKGRLARILREHMELFPKQYRQLLVKNTKVVETQMCNSDWPAIDYSHVPSVANVKYNKAFLRNDEQRRREFLEAAKAGKVTIKSSVAYPHTIVGMMLRERGIGIIHDNESLKRVLVKNETAIAMWSQLPDVIGDGSRRILVCSDVSNSMKTPYSKTDDPFKISIALGIYCSERLKGPFHNAFITFSQKPALQYTKGDLYERLCQVVVENPRNTNLEAIFTLVLDTAVKNELPENEMPTDIAIISDMEFDQAVGNPKDDAFKLIRKMYADSGYDMPNIIFWNVNARNDHFPVKKDNRGVVLISGASQNAIKAVLEGVTTPSATMLKVVNTERYMQFTNVEPSSLQLIM